MNPPPRPAQPLFEQRRVRLAVLGLALLVVLGGRLISGALPAQAGPRVSESASSQPLTDEEKAAAKNELTAPKAIVLGIVEGATEFLPISSTGHLLVVGRAMNIGQSDATKQANDTYIVAIQIGAILAVALLYFGRIKAMAEGLVGRDPDGRRVLVAIAIAFIPAAVVGVVSSSFIEKHLFGVGPVVAAWIVGGIVILATAHRFQPDRGGQNLASISVRQAIIIGLAQCLALWPGTSRSLVTILAALFVGLSLAAAIEFSFLLGLLTVSAATVYTLGKHGSELTSTYGWINPLIGLVVAFVAAVVAVRWMVTYLQRHDLKIFGWYRLGIAAITIALVATSAI